MADAIPAPENKGLQSFLSFLKESYLGVAVISVALMIILPMPTILLDALLAVNLIFSLLILLIVIYSHRPTEFSLFPVMLLVSTVFSLALNVSSTRLILTKGEKFDGRLIRAFSSFVVGSGGTEGLVVGFIIFIIIIAVQVVVITKGASRVSEVAARFTLDGMQVKMMAVENEYSSGSITDVDAQKKKDQIQKEADFYGSMDGASKFISGNVKIGILITVIDVLGGIIIGVTIHGESMASAGVNYISLTIGDGLVSQLPALLISTAMGIVVTRAASTGDFSAQINDQMFRRKSMVYWICAGVLAILAFLPGFPWYILIPMSALIAMHAFRKKRDENRSAGFDDMMAKTKDRKDEKAADFPSVVPLDALSLELGYRLVPLVEKEKGAQLLERVQNVRRQAAFDLGLVIPKVRIIDNSLLDPSEYCFKIKGVDAGSGKINIGYLLCIDPGTVVKKLEGEITKDPAFGLPAIWVEQQRRDEAERAGYTVVDPSSIIATHLTEIVRKNAADILGLQDTQEILNALREQYPAVVDEAMREGKGLRVNEIQKVFHGLLREGVSIRNKVSILEAIANYAPISRNIWYITEKTRQALGSQICHQYVDEDKKLHVLTLDPALEQKIIDSKFETASGIISSLDPQTQRTWIKVVSNAAAAVREKGWKPVILCTEAARYLVKSSTDRELPDLAVLSVPEIVQGVIPEAIGVIRLESNKGAA